MPKFDQTMRVWNVSWVDMELGIMNENCELFSELCASCDLIIGGMVFPNKTWHKVSRVSSDNITENQTDYMAISERF